jgi:pimeloyl-ACP methyl ester carboxylesterase
MHMATRKITTTDGASIHVEERGEGPPLLLLHGLTGTGQDFEHALDLAALSRAYRLLLPDARGHGRSTNPGAFTFARCALDVVELLDALELESVRALGFSLGAKTLLHVATLEPARVSSMILVSVAPRFPESTRAIFRAAAARDVPDEEWTLLRARHVRGDDQIRALLRLPADFAANPLDMSFTAERLAGITAHTLVVAGERDELYPLELAEEVHRGIRGSLLWVIPGGTHTAIFGPARAELERRVIAFFAG